MEYTLLGFLGLACTAGLVSTLSHCAGMCGPMQMLLNRAGQSGMVAFHVGRILGYSLLGALSAALSSSVGLMLKGNLGISLKYGMLGFYFIAFLILWFGLSSVEKNLGRIFPITRVTQSLIQGQGVQLFWPGLFMSLLPCPSTLGALILALSTANPLWGALCMLAFGICTLPSLLAIAKMSSLKKWRHSQLATRMIALFFLGSGVWQTTMMTLNNSACCH
jgi:uncharacterized protein